MYKIFLFICFLAVTSAFVDRNVQDFERRRLIEERNRQEAEREQQQQQGSQYRRYRSIDGDLAYGINLEDDILELPTFIRQRRSQLPNSSGVDIKKVGDDTIGTIKVGHKTDKYDVGATWTKVLNGPNKAKPNFSIGGTYRW